ncbi:MAG: RDD family protein [Armatimonadota bacterium]|nr:MAG: RDD family protein [Armatimonadota bacterium]
MSEATAIEAGTARDLDRETAGIARRGTAAALDIVVLLVLITPLALPQLEQLMVAVMASDADLFFETLFEYDLAWWRDAGVYAVSFAYGVLMLARYGRTVGMMALRIRVTDLSSESISFWRAVLRTGAYLLPHVAAVATYDWSELAFLLISAMQTIGLLWIMVDRAHQGYHDKIARTLVMHERRYLEQRPTDVPETEGIATSRSSPPM